MSDHWNDLANSIGAEVPKTEPKTVPPESTSVEVDSHNDGLLDSNPTGAHPQSQALTSSPNTESKSKTEYPKPVAVEAPKPVPEAKPRNHWQKVAGALGLSFGKSEPKPTEVSTPAANEGNEKIDATPVTAKSVTAKSVTATPVTANVAAPDASSVPNSDQPPAAWQKKPPSMFARESKPASAFDNDTTAEPPVVDRPPAAPPTVESLFVEEADDDPSQQKYDKEHAKRELAALFSEPVETSLGNLDFSTDTSSREAEDTAPRYVDDVTFDGLVDDVSVNNELSTKPGDSCAPSEAADSEEPRRGRRRRRGGRRGRRRPNEERSPADQDSDVEANDTTLDDGIPSAERGFASGIDEVIDVDDGMVDDGMVDDGMVAEALDIDDDFIADEEDAVTPTSEERSGRSGGSRDKRFRNIRSWKDTVGSIVDANIASRGSSSAPRGGGQRRRGGGGSGRRGGRGRPRRGSGNGGSSSSD